MQESDEVLDKSSRPCRFAGRRMTTPVPRYFLYGDTEPTGDWFLNVEPLDQRCRQEGWIIAPHAHPQFVQVIIVMTGSGSMTMEGESRQFSGPALIVVPMHTIHGFHYEESSSGWVLTVADSHIELLNGRAPELSGLWAAPAVVSCDADGWLSAADAALRALDRELDAGEIGGVIAAEALLTTLLVIILRQLAQVGELRKARLSGSPSALVSRFRALIENHFSDNWPLSKYAQSLSVSLVQLRAACLVASGDAPLKLVHKRVLIEAKRNLIYTAHGVAQIAYQLGFSDPAYFSRFFTQHVGEPPAQFRASRAFNHSTV
jgi:AraC family transcriptional regulator, transcriptional activator of pobA